LTSALDGGEYEPLEEESENLIAVGEIIQTKENSTSNEGRIKEVETS
jgi:hypothetical protein